MWEKTLKMSSARANASAGLTEAELIESFRRAKESAGASLLRAAPNGSIATDDFARSVVVGLSAPTRSFDCRYLYDARGSSLYEEITRQPEYYLTNAETEILERNSAEICRYGSPTSLLELASGSSIKTDLLLSALTQQSSERVTYVPIDISERALRSALERISVEWPETRVIGVHGEYAHGFALLRAASPTLGLFLGSTLGNFDEPAEKRFFRELAAGLAPGDHFLLGIDLVKDRATLEAAYNDRAGVTAAFTLNLFARMNRELGSEIKINDIEHVALYSEERERIEIHARFRRAQRIDVEPLERSFRVEAGEEILVEISRKFRVEKISKRLAEVGLRIEKVYTDEREQFGALLARRADD